jgi:hypothetical protein
VDMVRDHGRTQPGADADDVLDDDVAHAMLVSV